ncbi:MAG TPA: chemotaxis protein CheA, partial [Pirellulaceae bacterium]|nr:chemotaxis protein CheA [Pirellulaceae bacterium]
SIKGNAGFFGLAAIKKFSHALENTLDEVRNGRLSLTEDLSRAFVEGFDVLDEMLSMVTDGEVPDELGPREQQLLRDVAEAASQAGGEVSDEERLLVEISALAAEIAAAQIPQASHWSRRLRDLLPATPGEAPSPATEALTPTMCAGLRFAYQNHDLTARLQTVLKPFLAAENGLYERATAQAFVTQTRELATWCESISAAAVANSLRSAAESMQTVLSSPLDLDAMLLGIVWEAVWPVLAPLRATGSEPISIEPSNAEPISATTEASTPAAAQQQTAGKARLIRVKEEHLDDFVGDVSRLFITCERLKDLHTRMSAEKQLRGLVDELKQINAAFYTQTNALQHSVVSLRNVPAQALFGKFPRMGRTLAANLGKQLDITLAGEEHGIDKSLVEELDSPLTHMVRNVCDHGIETPDERALAGKSPSGQLLMKCELTRTHILITVQDDGRGIDPQRLRRKAIEKQLFTAQQVGAMSDQEALDLIFHPGFSTAEQITEVSGRGVGMDVVRTTLRELDGDVTVSSTLGQGTTFFLTIPIRQAVLVVDGLLLRDGAANYVVPLEQIREIVEIRAGDLKTVQNVPVAIIRGEPIAAIPLADMLNLAPNADRAETLHGVVLRSKEGTLCMLAERVLGQRKVVISNLREILPQVDKIAGVAQLGGGKLALVLSAPDLIRATMTGKR